MKKVAVGVARNTLTALIHEAEAAPIEIVRHGKPVAVLLSKENYDKLRAKAKAKPAGDFWDAVQRYRAEAEEGEPLDVEGVFDNVRDPSTSGR